MRTIARLHEAAYAPIGDLLTYSPLPSENLSQIDPFLFLNHHGPQHYGAHNKGLPFGPHPHRGMETVTFILEGDILHEDTSGAQSIITAGGVQWMTAGRGLVHVEESSPAFKEHGGDLEILQLWLNLPAKLKMTAPRYLGLQKDSIPVYAADDGKVKVQIISGSWDGQQGAFHSLTDVQLNVISFEPDGELTLRAPSNRNVLFYVIRGGLLVNGQAVTSLRLVEFNSDGDTIQVTSEGESVLLFGFAKPLGEPVVAQGPFVMNTEDEIHQAYMDYQMGKFGHLQK
ncbi:pirin family protein [bacterium]|nr:MAG: pirin family protein [bacterium]